MARLSRILRNSNARKLRGAVALNTTKTLIRFPQDFTYLGAYIVPDSPGGGQAKYGRCGSVRIEPTDGTNTLHHVLLNGTPTWWTPYEVRAVSPGTGSPDPKNPSNYPEAPVVKTYGTTGGVPWDFDLKRKLIYGGVEYNESFIYGALDGSSGVHVDRQTGEVWFNWGFGYSDGTMTLAKSCLKTSVNYAGDDMTATGPWRFNGQGWKSMMNGFVTIPDWYADTYLGGKRLASGLGGYFSVKELDDCSMGPSLTAFDPDNLPAEDGAITGTPLVGYWPGSNGNRGIRATPLEYNRVDSAALNQFSWTDRVNAAAWIDTPTHHGVLFFGHLGMGTTQYITSIMNSTYFRHFAMTYDPMHFTPVSGTPRDEIQPVYNDLVEWPQVNYTENYSSYTSIIKNITSIATTVGQSSSSYANSEVICPGHGITVGSQVNGEIRGSTTDEHNRIWNVYAVDADTLQISNAQGPLWTGTGSGGSAQLYLITSQGPSSGPTGADWYDNKLYVYFDHGYGVNGLGSKVMIMEYARNW